MKVVITKASNCDFAETKDFNTFEDLINFMVECGQELILRENFFFGDNPGELDWMPSEKAKMVAECKYEVKIYDGYIE